MPITPLKLPFWVFTCWDQPFHDVLGLFDLSQKECQGWMKTANLLIKQLTGQSIPMKDFLPSTTNNVSITKTSRGHAQLHEATPSADIIEDDEEVKEESNDVSPTHLVAIGDYDVTTSSKEVRNFTFLKVEKL